MVVWRFKEVQARPSGDWRGILRVAGWKSDWDWCAQRAEHMVPQVLQDFTGSRCRERTPGNWILSWALKGTPGAGEENNRRHSRMACGTAASQVPDEKYLERCIMATSIDCIICNFHRLLCLAFWCLQQSDEVAITPFSSWSCQGSGKWINLLSWPDTVKLRGAQCYVYILRIIVDSMSLGAESKMWGEWSGCVLLYRECWAVWAISICSSAFCPCPY